MRLFALAVAVLLTAAACSSSGSDADVVASSAPDAESAQAAPAVTPDDEAEAMEDDEDAMEDDEAMADDEDAMEDDEAMTDDEDAMADDEAMTDDEDAMTDDEAMSDEEDAMEDDEAMSDEEDAMEDDEAMSDDEYEGAALVLDFAGLEPLGDASVYEGWIIVDDAPVTTGRFNIDADGNAISESGGTHSFAIDADVDATAVVITIEPAVDPDPAPADTHVLAGDIVDGSAELTISHPAALGTDFADAAGRFILGTPTDGDGNNELSGVWFIDLPTSQGLDLPELPAGWVYEGWAVIDDVNGEKRPISTGRFVDPGAADDFDGFSGDQGGPAYPGEDFIVNAPDGVVFPTDLTNSTIVISVEPELDDSPAPFVLKPLAADVAEGTPDHVVQSLGAGPAAPTGAATITN